MKRIQFTAAMASLAILGACAGSISTPAPIQALSAQQKASLRLSDVSADAENGVTMGDADFALICEKVRTYIQKANPAGLGDVADASAYKMKIHFTRFDRGSAFARALMAGLGQIRIEAMVYLVDSSGRQVGQYEVSKDFSFGGIVGATTGVEDVEEGFAKSVAEILKAQT